MVGEGDCFPLSGRLSEMSRVSCLPPGQRWGGGRDNSESGLCGLGGVDKIGYILRGVLIVAVSRPVVPDSVTPWTAACQASLSLTISQSLSKFMFTASVMPSSRLILCHLFSFCPQSFPASRTFPMSHLFASDDQSTSFVSKASHSTSQ